MAKELPDRKEWPQYGVLESDLESVLSLGVETIKAPDSLHRHLELRKLEDK